MSAEFIEDIRNRICSWQDITGHWKIQDNYIKGMKADRGILLGSGQITNFIFQLELKINTGDEAGVIFGFEDPENYFVVSLNTGENLAKYYRSPGGLIQTAETEIKVDSSYQLQVQSGGRNLKVFLEQNKVIDVDDYYSPGRIGLWLSDAEVKFSNIQAYEINPRHRNLNNLELNTGMFFPGFNKRIYYYHGYLDQDQKEVKIKTAQKDKTQKIIIEDNKKGREDDKKSQQMNPDLSLSPGENCFSLHERSPKKGQKNWPPVKTTLNLYRRPQDHLQEDFRPQYHFTPERGWLNDPNGLVYYKGKYHLFYQYHPFSKEWGPMHWGHAVSNDLVHWEHWPTALYPDQLGTIFSGSAVIDEKDTSGFFDGNSGMVAIFTHATGTEGQIQSLAYSKDEGATWHKYRANPVLTEEESEDFRDPKVFWHEETQKWIMVVAGGQVRIYSSPNLKDWKPESKNDIYTECPDLFELPVKDEQGHSTGDSRWVLNAGGREYYLGDFDGRTFKPETEALPLNYGPDAYAAQTYAHIPTEDGRRIMASWMANWKNIMETPTDPWRGRMNLFHELSLGIADGKIRLIQQPVEEIKRLRSAKTGFTNKTIPEANNILSEIKSRTFEINVEFKLKTAHKCGINVLKNRDQKTVIGYDAAAEKLYVDRSQAGKNFGDKVFFAPLSCLNNKVKLHIFVDESSVEVYGARGAEVISVLTFSDPANNELDLFAEGGGVIIKSLQFYEMDSIWSH